MSVKRVAANQKNAKRSTGPRTAEGKSRSRQNALKHGLAVPASAMRELTNDVLLLARSIAGDAHDIPLVLQAATRVAEATIDVQRARRARVELLNRSGIQASHALQKSSGVSTSGTKSRPLPSFAQYDEPIGSHFPGFISPAARLECEIAAFEKIASQLENLEQYERRSTSRRDRAIRAFTEIKAAACK